MPGEANGSEVTAGMHAADAGAAGIFAANAGAEESATGRIGDGGSTSARMPKAEGEDEAVKDAVGGCLKATC